MIEALVTPAVTERFWPKVIEQGDCWVWTAAKIGRKGDGYGHFAQGGPSKMILAHRWAYESMVGPIPEGLELDHLCRNKSCVRPDHLDPVTHAVNIERNPNAINNTGRLITHCPQNHPYDEANTRWYRGCRACRTCARMHTANHRARKTKAAAQAGLDVGGAK